MQIILDVLTGIGLHCLIFVVGMAFIAGTLISAVQTFLLPRNARSRISSIAFLVVRIFFDKVGRTLPDYYARDRWWAFYVPISLLVLPGVWMIIVLSGYSLIYWAFGTSDWWLAIKTSGSSFFTLGYISLDQPPYALFGFSEAAIGLSLLALLIAYLPTMYSAFSQREQAVTMLEIRAGSPPSPAVMFIRLQLIGLEHNYNLLHRLWEDWEIWFVNIDESHTSLPAINFFRSPQPDRSWITAAQTVLDVTALALSTVEMPPDAQANLCIRGGFVALRHIADYFRIPFDPDPQPTDPISLTRAEFDLACEQMRAVNVPLRADLDQAWRDFAGWRVNYDTLLLDLAEFLIAPPAPWLSEAARAQRSVQRRYLQKLEKEARKHRKKRS